MHEHAPHLPCEMILSIGNVLGFSVPFYSLKCRGKKHPDFLITLWIVGYTDAQNVQSCWENILYLPETLPN